MSRVTVTMDATEVIRELDRLSSLPGPETRRFESILASSFTETQAAVHVITGQLKASGRPSSQSSDGSWTGTISYARHPGIFELARGNTPTMNHPEGGHGFFGPAYDTPKEYERAMLECLEG